MAQARFFFSAARWGLRTRISPLLQYPVYIAGYSRIRRAMRESEAKRSDRGFVDLGFDAHQPHAGALDLRRRRSHSRRRPPRRSRSHSGKRQRSPRRRPSTPITDEEAIPTRKNPLGTSIAREFRMDLRGGSPFADFLETIAHGERGFFGRTDIARRMRFAIRTLMGAICSFKKQSAMRGAGGRCFRTFV